MNINVKERIQLLNILPKQGDYRTLRVIHALNMKIGFSSAELNDLKFQDLPSGQVKWEPSEVIDKKEIPINKVETEIITNCLRNIEKKQELHLEHLSLYEKFCEENEQEQISRPTLLKP